MSFEVRRLQEKKRSRFEWKRALFTVLSLGGALAGVARMWEEEHEKKVKEKHRTVLLKRLLLISVAILCGVILLAGTVTALKTVRVFSLNTFASLTGAEPPVDANGFTNLLLLGQGDEGHDGKDLTDTLIVASVDTKNTNSVFLLSLPRDLYLLNTEKMGAGRINSMYRDYSSYLHTRQDMELKDAQTEAMNEVAREVSKITGLELHDVIKVDFDGFVGAVDALGGIEINVPEAITDTSYPDENYGYEVFHIDAGLQTLDGATALKYARSRHSSSDFDRSARQQMILTAMGEKARSVGIIKDAGKIVSLLRVLSANVMTTMPVGEMVGLAQTAKDMDRSNIVTMQLNDHNGLYGSFSEPGGFLYAPPREQFGGASVLLPVSVPEYPITWKQVQTLGKLFFGQRKVYLSQPHFNVLNAGAPPGAARLLASELIRYGFTVDNIDNASIDDIAAAFVAPRTEADKPLAEFFSTLLGIQLSTMPTSLPVEEVNQITIVLGENYRFKPLQDSVLALP